MFVSCPFFLLLGHVCCLPSVSSLLACAFLCFPLSRLFLFLCFSPVSSLWDRVRWYPRPWVGLCPGQGGWRDAPSFAFLSLLCFFSLGAGRVPAALVACAFLRLLSCLWLLSVLVISFFAVLCLVSCVWVVLPLLSFDFIYPYLSSSSPTPCKFLFFRRYDQATQNVNAFPCYVKFHHRSLGLLGCLFKRFKTGGDVEDWLKAMANAVPVFFWGPLDRLSICVRGLVTTASMQKGSVKVNWLDRVLMVQRLGVTPEQFEKSVRQLAPEMADVIGDWSQFR